MMCRPGMSGRKASIIMVRIVSKIPVRDRSFLRPLSAPAWSLKAMDGKTSTQTPPIARNYSVALNLSVNIMPRSPKASSQFYTSESPRRNNPSTQELATPLPPREVRMHLKLLDPRMFQVQQNRENFKIQNQHELLSLPMNKVMLSTS